MVSTAPIILFDLDGTLFDHPTAFARGIVDHLRALGGPYTLDDEATIVAAWQRAEDEHYERYLAGEIDYEGQRIARVRQFTAGYGVEGLDERQLLDWFQGYYEAYRAAWSAYADALPALDAILEALPDARFGIITNGELELQSRKVRLIGLADRIEHVVASGALGIAKPDPRIFLHALELFGSAPEHAVYVGDRLRVDAVGAARAGLGGVWLDRGADAAPIDATTVPDVHRITSLEQLPALLRSRSSDASLPVSAGAARFA